MRKQILILFCLLLSVFSYQSGFAQKYYPLVDTNKLWSGFGICTGCPHRDSNLIYFKFTQDTSIKGKNYKKVMLSTDALHKKWINDGYMRETVDRKVYYLEASYFSEVCYYNFNVKKGDTVFPGYPFIVDSINNILIGKQLRKRFYINDSGSPCDILIEGIGSVKYGLLYAYMCGVIGTKFSLLCYSENDTLKYENPEYNLCPQVIDNVNKLTINNDQLTIFPNPVDEILNVEFSILNRSKVSLKVYDVLGRELKQLTMSNKQLTIGNEGKHSVSLDVKGLKSGVYFVKLSTDVTSRVLKFVKN